MWTYRCLLMSSFQWDGGWGGDKIPKQPLLLFCRSDMYLIILPCFWWDSSLTHQAATSSSLLLGIYCVLNIPVPTSLLFLPTCFHVADRFQQWRLRCSTLHTPPFFFCFPSARSRFTTDVSGFNTPLMGKVLLIISVQILGNVVCCWDIWFF